MIYLSILLIIFGLYFIALDYLKMPTLQTSKGIISFNKHKNKKSSIDVVLDDLASKLSNYIILSEYKKEKMDVKLSIARIYKTPEKFLAENYIKILLPVVLAIPLYFIFPILLPILLAFSVITYFKNINKLDYQLRKTREKIEYEIPRFTRDIAEYLKSDRNILLMLERYRKTAGDELKRELDITITDMKTGNYETALTRFESRVQSPMLSDVIRGLISVIRGDNAQFYFQLLAHDFKSLELEKLKAEAMRVPGKIKKYSFILLACMLLLYIVVIAISIIQNMGGMF